MGRGGGLVVGLEGGGGKGEGHTETRKETTPTGIVFVVITATGETAKEGPGGTVVALAAALVFLAAVFVVVAVAKD